MLEGAKLIGEGAATIALAGAAVGILILLMDETPSASNSEGASSSASNNSNSKKDDLLREIETLIKTAIDSYFKKQEREIKKIYFRYKKEHLFDLELVKREVILNILKENNCAKPLPPGMDMKSLREIKKSLDLSFSVGEMTGEGDFASHFVYAFIRDLLRKGGEGKRTTCDLIPKGYVGSQESWSSYSFSSLDFLSVSFISSLSLRKKRNQHLINA